MPTLRALVAILCWVAAPALAQVPDFYDPDTVRDLRLTFSQSNWWTLLQQNVSSETNIAANLQLDGAGPTITLPNVGVQFRGNTSYSQLPPGSQKTSFNVDTDWMVQGQDLLGYSNLNLNNGFHDPLFLREFLTYMIMRRHGVAPKCNFVRLWLNGVYWGIYINVEQPNKDMMKAWFRSNDGNRYRGFPASGSFANGRCAMTWLGSSPSLYLSAYQAKQGDGTDMVTLCNVLNNTAAAQLPGLLPAIFNVDQFYRYAAVMNITTQTDSYIGTGKDHFLYHDEVHGDFHVFPFDLNEALAASTTLDPWYNTTSTIKPAMSKTLTNADWRERYKAHYRTIVEETFNSAWLAPVAQRYHAMIAADVAADTKKLYTTAQFNSNLTQSVTISAGGTVTVPGLLPFIQSRETFLRARPDFTPARTALSNLARAPLSPNPTQAVTVTVTANGLAASIKLWWRNVGPFTSTPMFDDGLHGDGAANDGVWGASIPAQPPGSRIDYYTEARTATGLATFLPSGAEHGAPQYLVSWPMTPSPIVINEFVAQNQTGIVDENNQREDWLELYNTSNAPVNVGGMRLSDDLSQLKFTIPANTIIPAFGTLLVWCDEDGTQGPLHANFKLASTGETVALFAADGQSLHDVFVFGPQQADVATGRVLDGGPTWVTLPVPTPYARNEPTACGTRTFGALDPSVHGTTLAVTGSVQVGQAPVLTLSGAAPGSIGAMLLNLLPAHVDLGAYGIPGEVMLLEPTGLVVHSAVFVNAAGMATSPLSIPNNPTFAGLRLFGQAMTLAGTGFDTTRAIGLVLCP